MTQDEIIRMALEAELMHPAQQRNELREKAVERFAALVAAKEREACAKVCESDEMRYECSDECAAAIRTRGNNK